MSISSNILKDMDCFYQIQGKLIGHFFGIYNTIQIYCQHSSCESNDEEHMKWPRLS